MSLTNDEVLLIQKLVEKLQRHQWQNTVRERYYEGRSEEHTSELQSH